MKTYIIAEAGVNHNGSLEIAKQMIVAAKLCGADAVKFQTFKAETLVVRGAEKAEYQKKTSVQGENQFQMLKKLELSDDDHYALFAFCKNEGIDFLSSPFDIDSITFLDKLGLEIFKIPSGEITNLPYLRKIGSLNKQIILSTGMSDLGEINDAVEILISSGSKKENIIILHCNTEYPTPFEDVNLLAMVTIKNTFNVKIGYSDHTPGIEIPIAAVALGAEVIEKHFTLDINMEGPDHKASIEPQQLKVMVDSIRNIENALGNGIKRPSKSESKNKIIVRKSLVAKTNIKKGEIFSADNVGIKRPGGGISPISWDEIIGEEAKRNFIEDEFLEM